MVTLDALVKHLDATLDADSMDDYGPNGVQVEGTGDIDSVVTAVTASRNVIESAVERGSQAIVAHHGIFWKHGWPHRLTGWLGERVRLLMKNNISLLQYHLPLDLHPQMGNNACLLSAVGARQEDERFGELDLGFIGTLDTPCSPADFAERLHGAIGGPGPKGETGVHHIAGGAKRAIERVGVVTGAGQRFFEPSIMAGCDAFVTGEASEFVTHVARETGVHYYWAGHHATERGGIQALGEHIRDTFGCDVHFVDDANPV